MDGSHDPEGAESKAKTGTKRSLSLSPQTESSHDISDHPGAESAVSADKGRGHGPDIKRRNVAIYGEETGET